MTPPTFPTFLARKIGKYRALLLLRIYFLPSPFRRYQDSSFQCALLLSFSFSRMHLFLPPPPSLSLIRLCVFLSFPRIERRGRGEGAESYAAEGGGRRRRDKQDYVPPAATAELRTFLGGQRRSSEWNSPGVLIRLRHRQTLKSL